MLVSSIYSQIAEVTGLCDQALNFQAMSRAVELLANEGLFDAQIGYVEFANSQTNFVALPRECKTVLRLNINGQPTFFRNRLFEFTLNTNGSSTGDEDGLSWADRGYSPIQDERFLPGLISYVYSSTSASDAGKAITLYGKGQDGRPITETLNASAPGAPVYGVKAFYAVDRVQRDPTTGTCLLYVQSGITPSIIAQYAPDETEPNYRVIKLSRVVSNVRIMFRRDVYEITSLDSFIPINSKMAMIHATKAVRLFAQDSYEGGAQAMTAALDFLKKEQASRDEQDAMAAALEAPTAIDASLTVRDSIVVADVYDSACAIFGPIGRRKIFDKITTAFEVLRNKAQWDASTGIVDIWMPDRTQEVTTPYRGSKGTGYFVLPRFVESVISLNLCGTPMVSRNRWFEFHLNGTGERNRSSIDTWDDLGEVCIIQPPLVDADTHRVIPFKIVAQPDSATDNGKLVTVYGTELDSFGAEVEVWRSGIPGWTVPCVKNVFGAGTGAPAFTSISRITRDATSGFVRLYTTTGTASDRLLGLWYPDELEPHYRAIKVPMSKPARIRVFYRKRTQKISSLYEPIPLRSRIAIENMLRAIKVQETDPQTAMGYEEIAVRYLSEERINSTPSDVPVLEFNSGVMPGFTGNIS